MRATLVEVLESAVRERRLCWGFTCYDVQTAMAVTLGLETADTAGIILISPQSFANVHGRSLVRALRAVADASPVPVCLQLDHVTELAEVERAFSLGVDAVMADGSRMSASDNVDFTRAAVALAARSGGHIEAELGRVEGDEDVDEAADAGALTDPDEAERFATLTGADCLAISIGNVHGQYRSEPQLDWHRLEEVARRTEVPLSLHGASGLPQEMLVRAGQSGVVKANANTELRRRYLEVVSDRLPDVLEGARLVDLQASLIAELTAVVLKKLEMCNRI